MSSVCITNLCSYDFCEQQILVVVNTVWTTNILGSSALWTTSLETSVWIRALHSLFGKSLPHSSPGMGWIFARISRVVRFYPLWVVSLGVHWKMFMPTVSLDSIANCDTQYASSGFGGILKKGIEMESPHAVHVFFGLVR